MKFKFLLYLVASLLSLTRLAGAADAPAPLQVEIIPNHSANGKKSFTWFSPEAGTLVFDVLFTNISSSPVTVWEQNCSWGFRCLYFELVRDGKRRNLVRSRIDWDDNRPSPFTLAPQEHFVFHVRFGDGTWPTDWISEGPIVLRAIYQIDPLDDFAAKIAPEVWVGTVSSKPADFTIQ